MRLHKSFHRAIYPQVKFIPLVAALLTIALLLSSGRPAGAQPVNSDAMLIGPSGTPPLQVSPDEDASMGGLTVTSGGDDVALTPAFDAAITRYVATIDAESVDVTAYATRLDAAIDRVTVAGATTVPDSPDNQLDTSVNLVEGAITPFSLRVLAKDGVSTGDYRIDFSRPAPDTVSDITIESSHAQYIAGFELLELTLTREGDTTDSLDVTLNLDQTQAWLSTASFTVTFPAGANTATRDITADSFSSGVTQSGLLIATLAPVDGYDTSKARAQMEVISQDGPAVTVMLEDSEYTFGEDAGQAKVVLVAKAAPGLPRVPGFLVAVVSADQSAAAGTVDDPLSDYLPVSAQFSFDSPDFQDDAGSLVASKEVSVTILDDDIHEGDESFYLHVGPFAGSTPEVATLDAEGNLCDATCANPYPVTITDNDPAPAIAITADPAEYVAGLGVLRFTLTRVGGASDSLDITVNITQDQPWLSETSRTATFGAGDAQTILSLSAGSFSSDVSRSGDLVATVAMVDGYDTGGATATVRVISQEGPAVTVMLGDSKFTFPEDAGTVDIPLVARAAPGIRQVPTFSVRVRSLQSEADSPHDYDAVSELVQFDPAHFSKENGALVARRSASFTINDDLVYEGDEGLFLTLARAANTYTEIMLLDARGDDSTEDCTNPYRVTIVDNDPEPTFRLSTNADHVNESPGDGNTVAVAITSVNGGSYGDDRTVTIRFVGSAVLGQDYTVAPADQDPQTPGYQTLLDAEETRNVIHLTTTHDTHNDPCEWVGASLAPGDVPVRHWPGITVVIIDDDQSAGSAALSVGLSAQRTGNITAADANGRDWFSFDATAGENYIIEVKHPLGAGGPYVPAAGGDMWRVPGYLVDPSILEVVDSQANQVLEEHAQGGFTLNFARAFFTASVSGAHRIAVGAGPEDRTGRGCYTISVRVDDHADDYRTDPAVALMPGESITARIDSDVAPDDPGLNSWDWASYRESAIPRQGVESLDDRDVFRFRIPDAGIYRLSMGGQPAGVGIWYVWDHRGNLFRSYQDGPVASAQSHYGPGAYYVEVGAPYESSGNTGDYTVSLDRLTGTG